MAEQKKIFRSDMKWFAVVSVPGAVVAGLLIWFGCQQYPLLKYDVGPGFPPGWIFYDIPWAMGGLLLFLIAAEFAANHEKKIVVTPQYLEYQKGSNTVFRSLWHNLSFTPPRQDRKRFRVFLISDGHHFVRCEDFFFPEFETMADVIRAAKAHARDELST